MTSSLRTISRTAQPLLYQRTHAQILIFCNYYALRCLKARAPALAISLLNKAEPMSALATGTSYLCVRVCICPCLCVFVCVCVCVCVCVSVSLSASVSSSVSVSVSVSVSLSVHMSVCSGARSYLDVYVCMYVCMYLGNR